MSGVVIAHAYDDKFSQGLGAYRFLLARLCRLYPLFLLGTLISIGGIAAALVTGVKLNWTWTSLLIASATSLAFLPSPVVWKEFPLLYPLNPPAWSLLYEVVVNFVFALLWPWLRGRGVMLVVAISASAIVLMAVSYGRLDYGVFYNGIGIALARVFFSFFLGVAILRNLDRWPVLKLPIWVIVGAAIGLLLLDVPADLGGLYDAACVLIFFPILIWSGSCRASARSRCFYLPRSRILPTLHAARSDQVACARRDRKSASPATGCLGAMDRHRCSSRHHRRFLVRSAVH